MKSVVPHVGTWIEIGWTRRTHPTIGSFPTWERGLKSEPEEEEAEVKFVVPHVGTWIEIDGGGQIDQTEYGRSPRGNVD